MVQIDCVGWCSCVRVLFSCFCFGVCGGGFALCFADLPLVYMCIPLSVHLLFLIPLFSTAVAPLGWFGFCICGVLDRVCGF